MSSELSHMWALGGVLQTQLVGITSYIPFLFRIAAFLIAVPFAICILLDAIAYGIARTLHLSMSQRRVPASPLSDAPRALDTDHDSEAGSEDPYGSGTAPHTPHKQRSPLHQLGVPLTDYTAALKGEKDEGNTLLRLAMPTHTSAGLTTTGPDDRDVAGAAIMVAAPARPNR